jgi:hypothetical protein
MDNDFSIRKSVEYRPRGTMTAFDLGNDFEEWKDTTEDDVPKFILRDSVRTMTI